MLHIALMSDNGKFLVAENGGGGAILANRDGIGPWETFRLFNRSNPGQELQDGDSVALQAWNGRFLSVANDANSSVNAETERIEASATFTLKRVRGAGVIGSGEQVALQATGGNYVVAEGGGGNGVYANRARRGPWETFTITIFRPQLIRLRSTSGRYVTAENGGGGQITVNAERVGLWETFSLINLSRSDHSISSGDTVALRTWTGNLIRVVGPGSIDGRANRATRDALFRIRTSGGEAVEHGQRISLQSLISSTFIRNSAGTLIVDSSSPTRDSYFSFEVAEQAPISFAWIPQGRLLPGRPFEILPRPVSGEHNLLVMHVYDRAGAPPLTASNDQISEAIFGRAPSLASWLRAMSNNAIRVRNVGVYGPIRVSSVPGTYTEISEILTAAENAGFPLASFARDGVIDNDRVKLVRLNIGAGGQNHSANGISRRGIRFVGRMADVWVSQNVDERSRMVLCHEISHLLLDVGDKYGQRRPIRGDVIADRTWVGDWEKFIIERVDGSGIIRNGERVMLRAHNGKYLSTDINLPHFLDMPYFINTEGPEAGEARVFTIANLTGGDFVSGVRMALRTHTGHYVTAELGGNSSLTANRAWARAWEWFIVNKLSGTSGTGIASGDTISLQTYEGGFYVVAETNGRDLPRSPTVDATDRERKYIWGGGTGQGGNFDNASANYRAVMLSLWERIRLGWVRPRYLTPDNRGCYLMRPFLNSREALILYDPQNPKEWYTVENRQYIEDVDEVPSSGIVISWVCEDEGYWRGYFNHANDPDWRNYHALYPAVISAAAPSAPPNMMERPVVFNHDIVSKRNDPNAAFTNQELALPLGNGHPSRFYLSFHPMTNGNLAISIR